MLLIVVALGVFGYIVLSDILDDGESDKSSQSNETSNANAGQDKEEISGKVTKEEMEAFAEEGKNPFGEDVALGALNDSDFQEYIHGMSHQKVRAEEKWYFYEINSTRIEWLLDGLREAPDLEHEQTYEDILKKWEKGDFSSVDDDHNAVWRLLGGTVGKATGILSEEEEKAYIEEHSEKKEPEQEE